MKVCQMKPIMFFWARGIDNPWYFPKISNPFLYID